MYSCSGGCDVISGSLEVVGIEKTNPNDVMSPKHAHKNAEMKKKTEILNHFD